MAFNPKRIILHDYGGTPENKDGVFNPYHTLVFPDGTVRYRNPNDPYGEAAPHAYQQNNEAIGLSYAGPVGSRPTPEAMKALQQEYERIQGRYGELPSLGHGEAFEMFTKGHPFARPSKDGREWQEAAWRGNVTDMSRVPEAGLQPLSLLPEQPTAVATYNPAPLPQKPQETRRVAEAPSYDPAPETPSTALPEGLDDDMRGNLIRAALGVGGGPSVSSLSVDDMMRMQDKPTTIPAPAPLDLGRLRQVLEARRMGRA